VRRDADTVLRAFFGDDLPADYTLADAVGGFVVQGTVQAANGGANDGVNAFDETRPMGDTGFVVCEPSEDVGGTGDGAGPTDAPDLMEGRQLPPRTLHGF
jgi:hypothetical protein